MCPPYEGRTRGYVPSTNSLLKGNNGFVKIFLKQNLKAEPVNF